MSKTEKREEVIELWLKDEVSTGVAVYMLESVVDKGSYSKTFTEKVVEEALKFDRTMSKLKETN